MVPASVVDVGVCPPFPTGAPPHSRAADCPVAPSVGHKGPGRPGDPDCTTESRCNATCPSANKQPMRSCAADGAYYCCGAPGCRGQHACAGNKAVLNCYCDGKLHGSPGCDTPECIHAFGAFAAATAARFRGNGIVFECLNEPNGMGHDDAQDIALLCKSAGAAFTARGEFFVGPALAGLSVTALAYLNVSMQAGILDGLSGLSVHPYRGTAPETSLSDWVTLRQMTMRHGTTPAQRVMPMLSGEWGYTSADAGCMYPNRVDEQTQAAYLARMWLTNTMAGVLISINYDWSDGSNGPADCESNFGSVHHVHPGQQQPPRPKPAFTAALTLQVTLGDFQKCTGRVAAAHITPSTVPAANVFIARFENTTTTGAGTAGANATGFAVWSNGTWTQVSPPLDACHVGGSAALLPTSRAGDAPRAHSRPFLARAPCANLSRRGSAGPTGPRRLRSATGSTVATPGSANRHASRRRTRRARVVVGSRAAGRVRARPPSRGRSATKSSALWTAWLL